MLRKLVSLLPPRAIRFFGRLQYRLPVVGPLIGYAGRRLVAGEGTIKYGVGAGLRIDATGLAPRGSLIRIATGADALETAWATTTRNPVQLQSLTVEATDDVLAAGAVDDAALRVRIL